MKRFVTLLLALIMLVPLLSACKGVVSDGAEDEGTSSSSQKDNATNSTSASTTQKPVDEVLLPGDSTEGLKFVLLDDKSGYELMGLGSCRESKIHIGTYNGLPVRVVGREAFKNKWANENLVSVTLGESIEILDEYAFGDCRMLESVTFADSACSLKEIRRRAFYGCRNLKEIALPQGVEKIGIGAFSGCSGLKEIDIPDSVRSIGLAAFIYCYDLESITLPFVGAGFGIDEEASISHFGYIFGAPESKNNTAYLPLNLRNVTICNDATIESNAFYRCTSIENITFLGDMLYIEDEAFLECSGLKSVTIENKYNKMHSIGSSAFKDCTSLTGITIPDSVEELGDSAFKGCKSLKSISLGTGIDTIEYETFDGCESLESVIIPQGVNTVFAKAFFNCKKLKSVTLPQGVSKIAAEVFFGCDMISRINYLGSVEEWGSIDRDPTWISSDISVTVVCSNGSIPDVNS